MPEIKVDKLVVIQTTNKEGDLLKVDIKQDTIYFFGAPISHSDFRQLVTAIMPHLQQMHPLNLQNPKTPMSFKDAYLSNPLAFVLPPEPVPPPAPTKNLTRNMPPKTVAPKGNQWWSTTDYNIAAGILKGGGDYLDVAQRLGRTVSAVRHKAAAGKFPGHIYQPNDIRSLQGSISQLIRKQKALEEKDKKDDGKENK